MSQPAVKWADIERYFARVGYEIYTQGGDAFVAKLPSGTGKRGKQIVRIGHGFSDHKGKEIPRGLISKIKRTFNVSRYDILNG